MSRSHLCIVLAELRDRPIAIDEPVRLRLLSRRDISIALNHRLIIHLRDNNIKEVLLHTSLAIQTEIIHPDLEIMLRSNLLVVIDRSPERIRQLLRCSFSTGAEPMRSNKADAAAFSLALGEDVSLPLEVVWAGERGGGADGDSFLRPRLHHLHELLDRLIRPHLKALIIRCICLSKAEEVFLARINRFLSIGGPWVRSFARLAVVGEFIVALRDVAEFGGVEVGGWAGVLVQDPGDFARVGVDGFDVVC